jgi:hypothetical protein
MDEPMTPMERLVVEYHVWKTQLFKPDNIMLACNHSAEFRAFKENMTDAQEQELSTRIQDAWKEMNPLDLGKALGEYEGDCPDLCSLGVNPLQAKGIKR